MKVVFVGPSLSGRRLDDSGAIVFRPPAVHGDVARAVDEGATVIGLIDGRFQQVQSVWHKEILGALDLGVQVLGAASMGALRAAECEPFGMIPVGEIARAYAEGRRWDDSDVALLHDNADAAYEAVTEPMVNVEATAERLVALGFATREHADCLVDHARRLFFADRSVAAIFAPQSPVAWLAAPYATYHVDQKALDALRLIDLVHSLPDQRISPNRDWQVHQSGYWQQSESPLTPD